MKPNEVYVEIQLLSKHGLSLRRIAAEVGCAVNTVRRHLAREAVPKYERKIKRVSKLAGYLYVTTARKQLPLSAQAV